MIDRADKKTQSEQPSTIWPNLNLFLLWMLSFIAQISAFMMIIILLFFTYMTTKAKHLLDFHTPSINQLLSIINAFFNIFLISLFSRIFFRANEYIKPKKIITYGLFIFGIIALALLCSLFISAVFEFKKQFLLNQPSPAMSNILTILNSFAQKFC
ncbi:MAG: hypothetical protein KBD31_05355 [Proteobacteria bacterium]|nr:hypothetical protein [Pseudomonadota bacterium]